jgi:hypothetical protein
MEKNIECKVEAVLLQTGELRRIFRGKNNGPCFLSVGGKRHYINLNREILFINKNIF